MVQRRIDLRARSVAKLQKSASIARAALAVKRKEEAENWQPRQMPQGIPKRPDNIVDYIVDYVQPDGTTFKNYSGLAKACNTSRQNVYEWKEADRIPDHYLPGIIMQTGINAAVLLVWNTANYGRPTVVGDALKREAKKTPPK